MNYERQHIAPEGSATRIMASRINAYDVSKRTAAVINIIDGLARTKTPIVRKVAVALLPDVDLSGVESLSIQNKYLSVLKNVSEHTPRDTSLALLDVGASLMKGFPKNEKTLRRLNSSLAMMSEKVPAEQQEEVRLKGHQLKQRFIGEVVIDFVEKDSPHSWSSDVVRRAGVLRRRLHGAASADTHDIAYLIDKGYIESLSSARIGEFLVAVGASELQAVTFGLLPRKDFIAAPDMERMVTETSNRVGKVEPKKLRRWNTTLFEPLELVTMRDLPERRTVSYRKTAEGEEFGDALVGHLLAFSERYPDVALHDLLGSINTSRTATEADGTYKVTSPFNRFLIVRELVSKPGHSFRNIDVLDGLARIGVNMDPGNLHLHLDHLERRDIITYSFRQSQDSVAEYQTNPSHPTEKPEVYRSYPTLTQQVWQVFAENLGQSLDSPTLYQKMITAYPGYFQNERKGFIAKIITIANHLSKSGYLIPSNFNAIKQSDISLTESQQTMLTDFVRLISDFGRLNPHFLNEGRRKAHEILSDPSRVAALVTKALEASPNMQKIAVEDTGVNICTLLADNKRYDAATIRNLLAERFGKRLTFAGVRYVIKGLLDSGQVLRKKVKNINYYSLANPEGEHDES